MVPYRMAFFARRFRLYRYMSRIALILAAVYFVIATVILIIDARQPPPSGWITMRQIIPFIVTGPASVPLAIVGIEVDLLNRFNLSCMLGGATAVVYGVVAGIARLVIYIQSLK